MIHFEDGLPHLETTRRTLPCGLDVVILSVLPSTSVRTRGWFPASVSTTTS